MAKNRPAIQRLVSAVLSPERGEAALSSLRVRPELLEPGETVSRAGVAMALNVLLFADLLDRVPSARSYAADVVRGGGTICFDHGALRTIDGPTGALPRGRAAFARILAPLGYEISGLYPLPRLAMTGHVFTHRDFPEDLPQFFVSELHVDLLPEAAQAAAARVFSASVDPLGGVEAGFLDRLDRDRRCSLEDAAAAMPRLVRAFGRHHPDPALADYECLLAHSAEAAWIATEGNAFNHATDRVPDVVALAEDLRRRGYPVKDAVEVSASGRVRQTAFLADKVTRSFVLPDGSRVERAVPGSFHEFISRDIDPATGRIDLRFDSGNATGIFAVTNSR